MRTRLSFIALVILLVVVPVLALLPSAPAAGPAAQLSAPPPSVVPASVTPVPFVAYPTRLAKTFTSLPLQPTHTLAPTKAFVSVPSETRIAGVSIETPISAGTATLIPFPSSTPTAFAGTPTPSAPSAFSLDGNPVDCYKGPGVEYIVKTTFKRAQIVGRDRAGLWWYLLVDKGGNVFINCWVSTQQVSTGGNVDTAVVSEPEMAQITQVQVSADGQPAAVTDVFQTAPCGTDAAPVLFHFTGRVFADGPIASIPVLWETDAPVQLPPEHTQIRSWNAPAEVPLDVQVPALAGTYFLQLRSPNLTEAWGAIQFEVKCQ